jgi:hypothetical protein
MTKFALPLVVAVALTGCVATPAQVSHKGQLIPAIDGLAMSCTKPYPMTRDCSGISGAKLVVRADGLQFKVASTDDGQRVMVMADKLVPSQYDAEQVHDKVAALAEAAGAKVVKLEAIASGALLMGYVFTFDRDVYSTLRAKAVTK